MTISRHSSIVSQQLFLPTGCLRLDIALRKGGIPFGFITEISGGLASGKTTLCLQLISVAQKRGIECAFIDIDHTLERYPVAALGIDPNKLLFSSPGSLEQALDTAEILSQSSAVGLIVIDSMAPWVLSSENRTHVEGMVSDQPDLLLARYLPRLAIAISHSNTALVITTPAVARMSRIYQGLEENPSRLALQMNAAIRLELRKRQDRQSKSGNSGIRTHVRIIKNRFAPCYQSIEIDIIVNENINNAGEIIKLALENGIVEQFDQTIIFHGKKYSITKGEALPMIGDDGEVLRAIEEAVRQKLII